MSTIIVTTRLISGNHNTKNAQPINMFKKYLSLILLCLATFPAMANHPEVGNYKIGGTIIISIFITYVLLKPLKIKSLLTKILIAALYFAGILSFCLGIAYILSM